MFQNLSLKITQAFRTLSGTTHITESMLKDSAKIIKRALQEADVANSVIQKLLSVFHEKTLGQAIRPDLKPADMLMKQFHDEILHVLGSEQDSRLQLNKQPSIIMLVGLQGAGKTTFAARLGHHLQHFQFYTLITIDTQTTPRKTQITGSLPKINLCFFLNVSLFGPGI